jgi:hypothetical protein
MALLAWTSLRSVRSARGLVFRDVVVRWVVAEWFDTLPRRIPAKEQSKNLSLFVDNESI